jgi:hypothetical protein
MSHLVTAQNNADSEHQRLPWAQHLLSNQRRQAGALRTQRHTDTQMDHKIKARMLFIYSGTKKKVKREHNVF